MTWFTEGLPDLSHQYERYGLWLWASGDSSWLLYLRLYAKD